MCGNCCDFLVNIMYSAQLVAFLCVKNCDMLCSCVSLELDGAAFRSTVKRLWNDARIERFPRTELTSSTSTAAGKEQLFVYNASVTIFHVFTFTLHERKFSFLTCAFANSNRYTEL